MMGMISIKVAGSFGNKGECNFSAMEGGHAYALTRAIAYLMTQMAGAIVKDHKLHEAGSHPPTSAYGTMGVKEMDGRPEESDRPAAVGIKELDKGPARVSAEVEYCDHRKDKRFCAICAEEDLASA